MPKPYIELTLLKRDEWQKERTAKAKKIVTTLQNQLLSVSKLQKRKIKDLSSRIYVWTFWLRYVFVITG